MGCVNAQHRARALVLLDLVPFVACIAVVVAARSALVQWLAGAALGLVVSRLFILGHDACHQSFTPHRGVNCWLERAQALLERKLAGAIVVQPFSWRWYADTARRCKLYDFKARRWTDFAGRPSAAVEGATG